jgi:beta-phosphoglucomutase-like phosphatase (HAD superfamily)
MNRLEAVLWDFDNTLSLTGKLSESVERTQALITAQELGLATEEKPFILPEDWSRYNGWARKKIAADVFKIDADSPAADNYRQDTADRTVSIITEQARLMQALQEGSIEELPETGSLLQPIHGAIGVLDLLRHYSVPQAIGTNSNRGILNAALPVVGMGHGYFQTTIAQGEARDGDKPSPSPYLELMGRLQVHDRAAVLVVEDSATGITAGRYAGAHVLALASVLPPQAFETMTDRPHAVAQNYEHAAQIIRSYATPA